MSRTIKFAKAGGLDVLQFIETRYPPGPHEVRQVQSDRHQSRRVDVAQGRDAVMRPTVIQANKLAACRSVQ